MDKNNTFRFDDVYFSKSNLFKLALIKKNSSDYLINLSSTITDFGAFSQMNFVEYQDEGLPFLRNQNIKNNLVDTEDCVFVNQITFNKLSLKLEAGDVVIPRVGTLGGAAVISEDDVPCTANQNLAQIKLDFNKLNPYFLSSFLCSDYGVSQVVRSATGNVQPWLNLENIGNLLIPILSPLFQNKTESIILKAKALKKSATTKYTLAEQYLLGAVGLAKFKPSTQNTNIKTFAQSFNASGRLDAEYYQPKYEDYENIIKSHPNGYTLINHEYEHFCTISRKPKAAYNYIEISDVTVSDGTNSPNLLETSELPDNAKYEVKKGDLIISKVRPNRGAVTVIESDADNLIVSGAFTVLREKPESVFTKEVLKVLLRTPIYREWMLQFNIGTQYPVIRDDDILNLPIPKIDITTQTKISELVQESFTLKAESERLLNVTKRAVEIAIEQDEAAGLAFIKKETEANHVIH